MRIVIAIMSALFFVCLLAAMSVGGTYLIDELQRGRNAIDSLASENKELKEQLLNCQNEITQKNHRHEQTHRHTANR